MIKFFFLTALLFTTGALAQWENMPPEEFPVPPPPEKSSEAYEQDFLILKKYQESRSKKDCATASSQEHPSFDAFFGTSELLSEAEREITKPLITKVMKLTERISAYHKGVYKRPRPYDTDNSLIPCAKKPGGAKSYPSSHAATSAAAACVLSKVFADRKEKILEYGEYIGELRVIAGVHHPSDVNTGRSLGKAVCSALEEAEDFQQDFQKMLEKIRKP